MFRTDRSIPFAIIIATASGLGFVADADLKTDLDALTGNQHTRIVWLRGGDRIDGGGALMGYDSKENKTHQILPATSGQNRPIICAGGHKVIVSINYKVHIVDWSGSNKTLLVDGVCSDAWIHPQTGKEWFVARTGGKSTGGKLYRYLLENPVESFLLYDRGPIGIDYFPWWQISADGKLAADFLPWPKAFVIDNGGLVSNGPLTQVSDGCWSSVAPDNSYFWFHLTCCPHKTLKVFKSKGFVTEIAINAGPRPSATLSDEFYHPKFASNGARFLVCTGGYHGNSGSNEAEIYLGKFASDYRGFENWVRVTVDAGTAVPDYTPDAWAGVQQLGPPVFTTLRVSAAGSTIKTGESVNLTVATLDQQGQPIAQTGTVAWSVNEGGALKDMTNTGATFTSNGTAGTFTVTASLAGKTGTIRINVIDPSTIHLRVNCGGPQIADNGIVWESSGAYVQGGAAFTFGGTHDVSQVTDPAPNAVYQTCQHQDHSYNFPAIPNGTYQVRLHFTDAYGGNRAMDYTIEDTEVLDNFNPATAAGGTNRVVVKEFSVTVSDGNGLQIRASQDQGNDVFESGIEIIAGAGQPTPGKTIQVLEPNGGKTYRVGETATIRWTASPSVVGVTIEVSVDSGKTWMYITTGGIQVASPNWGAFPWVVPATAGGVSLLSTTLLVRVADYTNSDVADESDSFFAIGAPARVLLRVSGSQGRFAVRTAPAALVVETGAGTGEPYRLEMIDSQGRVVNASEGTGGACSLGLEGEGSGVFLLRVRTLSRTVTRQVIVGR